MFGGFCLAYVTSCKNDFNDVVLFVFYTIRCVETFETSTPRTKNLKQRRPSLRPVACAENPSFTGTS